MSLLMLREVLAAALLSGFIGAQEPSTVSTLERLAAKAAMERLPSPKTGVLKIGVDRMIVHSDEAPGGRDSVRRADDRMQALAQGLNATVVSRGDVLVCADKTCMLRGVDVLVSVSEPTVKGNRATVTVTTVVQGRPRRVQYQTLNVIFERRAGEWRLVKFEELGIS